MIVIHGHGTHWHYTIQNELTTVDSCLSLFFLLPKSPFFWVLCLTRTSPSFNNWKWKLNTTGVKSRKIILCHFNKYIKGRNYTLHIIKDFLFSIIELYLKDCKMKQEQNVLWSINYKLNCIIEFICWWNMTKNHIKQNKRS